MSSITSKFYKSGGGGGEGVGRDDARPAPPPAHKTEMEKTEKGTASRESEVREREEGDRAMENKDEGWDEDEWEVNTHHLLMVHMHTRRVFYLSRISIFLESS